MQARQVPVKAGGGQAGVTRVNGDCRQPAGFKENGLQSVWPVHISPLFRPIEQLLAFKIVKICPRPAIFSLRFFKSDRLPEIFK
ncbi:hypothetical protein EBAPG3_007725 [Nitrosospira lacus]|uniref:Uncharacterized protein n=1 Tax=Nitrosospira lacus TaxID=1288494 RepID=A0A1W6SPD9_9PROT|nr:hypothetical protein EBAPG3_007725 [Nitrosospira lacus]